MYLRENVKRDKRWLGYEESYTCVEAMNCTKKSTNAWASLLIIKSHSNQKLITPLVEHRTRFCVINKWELLFKWNKKIE